MGLSTQDPDIQKEHTKLYKILKFRINWVNTEQDTATQNLKKLLKNVWMARHLSFLTKFFTILNGCILFNIGPINKKLDDFVKLGMLFLNIGVLC